MSKSQPPGSITKGQKDPQVINYFMYLAVVVRPLLQAQAALKTECFKLLDVSCCWVSLVFIYLPIYPRLSK